MPGLYVRETTLLPRAIEVSKRIALDLLDNGAQVFNKTLETCAGLQLTSILALCKMEFESKRIGLIKLSPACHSMLGADQPKEPSGLWFYTVETESKNGNKHQ